MKFYMHAGSYNHGCEAIVRSTLGMTDQNVTLYSEHPDEDTAVGLDEICHVEKQGGSRSKRNPFFVLCKIMEKITHNPNLKHWYAYKNVLKNAKEGELFLSIGGDNYCYNANKYLMFLNAELNKKGAKTGLWGCSIEPEILKDKALVEDMRKYSFISARESITYNALKEAGLTNVHLYPDPAFTLPIVECELPEQFQKSDVVGINLSPLVQKLDGSGKLVLENYVQLVRYILEETDMSIALIPHVCKPGNDDRDSVKALAAFFPDNERVFSVNDEGTMDCRKLKYIISKCRFVVTARTHASIAAYSTCVPTLVVGYSVKARGIAKDLFEAEDGFVLDIKDLVDDSNLRSGFKNLQNQEMEIKHHLTNIMTGCIESAQSAGSILQRCPNEN